MAVDPPVGGPPVVLSPPTYQRHDAAVRYVEGVIRTRAPRPSTERFPGIAPGAWGFLAAGDTISGSSGMTLGEGDVELCTRDGADCTGTGEMVHVYNTCEEITAPDGGLMLAMVWVDAWAIG